MIDLSLCIINRDDCDNLVRLIKAARPYVGEIVVVDTGSADDSIASARHAGADHVRYMPELLSNGVLRNFAEARQHSFDMATKSWLLWLDTDDDLSDWEALPAVIEKATAFRNEGHVGLNIKMWYDYSWTPDRSQCIQSFTRERIVHRDDGWTWRRPVHEYLRREGPEPIVVLEGIRVVHLSQGARGVKNDRNLRILREWEASGQSDDPALFYYLGDECLVRDRFEEAFTYFDRCVKSPMPFWTDRAAFRAGRSLVNSGRYADAINYLSSRLQQNPEPANVYWELARALYIVKEHDLARTVMHASGSRTPIIGEDPTFGSVMINALGMQCPPTE